MLCVFHLNRGRLMILILTHSHIPHSQRDYGRKRHSHCDLFLFSHQTRSGGGAIRPLLYTTPPRKSTTSHNINPLPANSQQAPNSAETRPAPLRVHTTPAKPEGYTAWPCRQSKTLRACLGMPLQQNHSRTTSKGPGLCRVYPCHPGPGPGTSDAFQEPSPFCARRGQTPGH